MLVSEQLRTYSSPNASTVNWWQASVKVGLMKGRCADTDIKFKMNSFLVGQYHNSVWIHNCMKTMSDRQHCAVLKLFSDGGLDQGICPKSNDKNSTLSRLVAINN